jgi:hypothetical protein
LAASELRHAVADGAGDPILMAMIRAAYERNANAIQRLSSNVSCRRG